MIEMANNTYPLGHMLAIGFRIQLAKNIGKEKMESAQWKEGPSIYE